MCACRIASCRVAVSLRLRRSRRQRRASPRGSGTLVVGAEMVRSYPRAHSLPAAIRYGLAEDDHRWHRYCAGERADAAGADVVRYPPLSCVTLRSSLRRPVVSLARRLPLRARARRETGQRRLGAAPALPSSAPGGPRARQFLRGRRKRVYILAPHLAPLCHASLPAPSRLPPPARAGRRSSRPRLRTSTSAAVRDCAARAAAFPRGGSEAATSPGDTQPTPQHLPQHTRPRRPQTTPRRPTSRTACRTWPSSTTSPTTTSRSCRWTSSRRRACTTPSLMASAARSAARSPSAAACRSRPWSVM